MALRAGGRGAPGRSGAPLVLIAGGGTVGHLAPGFAVAEVLRREGVDVCFVTPGDSREAAWFPPKAPPRAVCPAPRLPRRRWEWPLFPARLLSATIRATWLVRRLGAGAVLGLGGWPCVPAFLAGRVAGTRLTLVASDETPGVAVRRLAPLADRIYAARAGAARALGGAPRVMRTGPVIRTQVLNGTRDPSFFGLSPDRLTLLVTGGSLGAKVLNETLSRAVSRAAVEEPDLARRIQVIHSVGEGGVETVRAAYVEAGVPCHVVPFVSEMGRAYRTADLVVSRAGALTCAELKAVGTPAVLVPYPHHADRQQYANAQALADEGAARILEESELGGASVRREVLGLLLDASRRGEMARALAATAPDGAGQIAADLIRLLDVSGRGSGRAGAR